MSTVLTIIAAILIFGVIIFVHEFGHFIAARIFGVKVNEFAIGMGPAIYKKQGKNTLYSVRAIPMGGFCAMEGEDEEKPDDPGALNSKKPWQRIIILAAGAAMNLLLGFIVVTVIVIISGSANGFIASTTVESVYEECDAARFLQPGDKIVAVNGTKVNIHRDLTFEMEMNGGSECELKFRRDGKTYTEKFTPMQSTYADGSSRYAVGVIIKQNPVNPLTVIHEGFFQTIWMVKLVFVSLGMLFTGEAAVSDLSGPVGVVSAMNTAAKYGLMDLIFLAGFLAVNIGVMNLLPLPALDGGRIFFVLIEIIFRKPVPRDKEGYVHFIGFILLIGLMLYATWNDVVRIITGVL